MRIGGSSLRYKPRPRDETLERRILQVLRPGMGYRGAWATLRGEFHPLSPKRVYRLWKELRLNVRPKPKRRRKGMPMPDAPTAPNQLWCLDFVHDTCLNGSRLKILAVVDEFTRECLALEAAGSIKAPRVRAILASLFADRGEPKFLRSDNGPEFVANSLTVWLAMSGTESRFIKPGSPWQNAKIESFNGKLRAELLNAEVFANLADAQLKLAVWRRFYNEERPHSSLGYLAPASYAKTLNHATMPEGTLLF
jgi:putative transposase